MQSPEAANGTEGYMSALGSAPVRSINGFGNLPTQQFLPLKETPLLTGHGIDSEAGVGSNATSPWRQQSHSQSATVLDALSGSTQDNGKAWEGSLWSDANNIWSTGPQPYTARDSRRSMELPNRAGESFFNRQPATADSRRSLDSLSTLQAIWQEQQQRQHVLPEAVHNSSHPPGQPFHERQREHYLSQQLSSLAMQDGASRFAPQPPARPPQPLVRAHDGFRHTSGPLDSSLSYQNGLSSASVPHGSNGLLHHQPHFVADSLRSSQPVANGSYQNSRGVTGVLANSLSAAQLQAALQDPASASLLRQQLEASALLAPALSRSHTLEETLLLARQAANGHAGLQNGAIRQPPPPPPRSTRPQLPPPMQLQPSPPPRLNGLSGAKKATAFTPQRTSVKDRSSLLGSKPKASMEVLNRALEDLVESLHPSKEELQKQQDAFQKVSRLLKARWPHSQVHQFGSTANSLSICNNNDMDVCLEIVEPEGDPNFKAQLIEEMGDLMSDAGMVNVLPLPKARVPVVKFAVPDTATKVDVSVNNTLAIVNTKLLRDYSAIDGRLLQLAFIVKHWAKRRQVNDSYRGTLSSYCYVLMCIHHLQSRPAPVLPCLQAIQPPTHIRTVGRWNCDYYDKSLQGFGKENTESLADLVWSFFENWAWRHDYNNAVVSVRTGSLLTKAQKDWTRRIGNERHLICIEDPFETSHDLGRTVDRQTSGVLHKEFERAASVLRDQEEPLAQLFEPFRAGKPE